MSDKRVNLMTYMGGKFYALDVLYSFLPSDLKDKTFVIAEVFGGSAPFLLNFPPSLRHRKLLVYNDVNGALSALFKVMTQPDLFIKFMQRARFAIQSAPLVDFYVETAVEWGKMIYKDKELLNDEQFVLKAALNMYLAANMVFAGRVTEGARMARQTLTRTKNDGYLQRTGVNVWKRRPVRNKRLLEVFCKMHVGSTSLVDSLLGSVPDHEVSDAMIMSVVERLRHVIQENGWMVECDDFQEVIERYDSKRAFFYLDPPYKELRGYYSSDFTDKDHERLLEVLQSVEGRFLLSYDASPWVVENYENAGFEVWDVDEAGGWRYGHGTDASGREVLITNYGNLLRRKVNPAAVSSFMG